MKDRLKKTVSKEALKKTASRIARIRISRRLGIGLLGFLIAIPLLYAALGFWVLPSWIKSKAQDIAAEKLQRQLVISKLDFNPFTFTLNIEGLSLSEIKSDTRFAAFDQLYVEISPWSALKMTPVVTEFKLVKPFVRLVRVSEKERNFDDILALFKTSEDKGGEDASTEAEKKPQNAAERREAIRKRKFGIYNFQIVDARIELENHEKGTKTLISDFHVGLPYLYRGPIRGIERHVEPQFEAMINGKKLEIISEKPSEDSRDRILKLSLDNIDLTRIFSYIPFHPAYKLNEGRLDLNLSLYIHRPKDGETSMDIGGRIALRSVHMTQHGKPLFDMEKLDLHLGQNSPIKGEYRIDRLEIVRPEIHAISDRAGVLNFASLLAHADKVVAPAEDEGPQPETGLRHAAMKPGEEGQVIPASAQADESGGITFALKELLVKKARLRYTDQSDQTPMDATASSFDLAVNDVLLDSLKREIRIGRVSSASTAIDIVFAKERGRSDRVTAGDTESGEMANGDDSYTLRFARLDIANWSARIKNSNTADFAALPVSAVVSQFGLSLSDAEVNLGTRTVRVGEMQSSRGSFDVALHSTVSAALPEKEEKKADSASAFTIQVGKMGIANWSGKVKSSSNRDSASPLFSAALSRLGVMVENAEIDLKNSAVTLGQIRSTGGVFDVLMENDPPKVPVTSAATEDARSPFHIQIDRVDVANWSGRVKNSNRHDPFEMPFSASMAKLGVVVDKADISMKDQRISVAAISSRGGNIDIELEPYRKPGATGKRAVSRAALLAAIIEAKKVQPADGFAISVEKVAVSDWSARMKDRNTTDHAGLPVSGRVQQVDLALSGVTLDTKKRDVRIGEVVSRGGVLMAQLEKHEKVKTKKTAEGVKPVVMPSEAPYAVHIDRLAIAGWSVRGRNINQKNPLVGSITDISASGQDISSVPGEAGRLSVRATVDKTGKIAADGKVSLSPLDVNLALDMTDVSMVAIQPYIEDYVNLTMSRANLSLTGSLVVKENSRGDFEGGYRGDISIARLRTLDQINKDAFIRWNRLALKDVEARFLPLSVNIKQAELDNFFARVILNADGRLNLHNIMRSDAGGQVSLTETDSELDELVDTGDRRESAVNDNGNMMVGKVRPDADGADANQPVVFVEKLVLKKGQVRFTDNFIKPNYTANISEMEGTVTGLSSDPDAIARLDIRGQVNRAPLVVAGTISPLRENLALDVKAQVRGMELAQFSSYTSRYIGYGIDKGKLSFDVEYKLEEGVLVAQNRLILDQLVFGEKVPGEPVTSLPVELAVSLLKDSKGIIDINLPIGGSLEDPNFSIGGILAKVFLSSLKRVILAPFSFLSIKFGGGEELAWLEFSPGSGVIPEKEIPRLQALALALAERPMLKLDITGRYDSVADRDGLARAALDRRVRTLKRRDLQEKGQTTMMSQLNIDDSEYPELLERVYRDADVKKPRNFIGMQKKLSVAEMEQVLIDGYEATEEEFLALAYQRAERVKAWLVEKGRVADSRLFLLASKAGESSENGETVARVDFVIQQ